MKDRNLHYASVNRSTGKISVASLRYVASDRSFLKASSSLGL